MVKCPKCGEEIDRLMEYLPMQKKSEIFLDDNGNYDRWWISEFESDGDIDYECPECSAVLFKNNNIGEIEDFLAGRA